MYLRLLAPLVLLAGSLPAADPELLSLSPPDTQVMAGINFESVMLAPLGQYILSQGTQSNEGLQKLIDTTGFDPRRDLREVLFSSPGPPGRSGVALVRGTFNVPKIVEAALADGETIETYKGVQIVQWKGRQEQALALADPTLVIAGDAASVRAAIDRKSAPSSVNSTLAVAVNAASATQDAWFVSMVPPSQLQPAAGRGQGQNQGPMAFLQKILQASGGVKFGASVVVSLKAVAASAADASQLADALKGLAGMAQIAAGKDFSAAAAADLLKSLEISAEGNTTKVSLSIPEQQLEQIVRQGGAAGHVVQP